ncbi:hypothetical protein M951_chr3197 (nucleomorph) [Lotharella oceanica]|uniref:Uncharacterized protein n=1 Tax=Lotharella oceanica TaxID=641309 RepID=A0A060DBN2_9EUKA|nr:hypothetical protein M951_chr18 [Lotharella oceanica]AIB09702.1 hypothetical protein M951_chr1223 [Lotharella oceanica]AIB09711.1 hypothetical protein M951_chr28 [Lotharella oceanica]AIB09905.1 hypothetical protein M951_chr2213 [Lotharella oceanica]AIB09914.1 hypothetical protein M951_chr38 [Lotharella oceanica]
MGVSSSSSVTFPSLSSSPRMTCGIETGTGGADGPSCLESGGIRGGGGGSLPPPLPVLENICEIDIFIITVLVLIVATGADDRADGGIFVVISHIPVLVLLTPNDQVEIQPLNVRKATNGLNGLFRRRQLSA